MQNVVLRVVYERVQRGEMIRFTYPANTIHESNVGLMLRQRRRQ